MCWYTPLIRYGKKELWITRYGPSKSQIPFFLLTITHVPGSMKLCRTEPRDTSLSTRNVR